MMELSADNRGYKKTTYCSSIFFILSGTADVIMYDKSNRNKEVLIAELRSGEFFGVSDLLKITVSFLF